MRATKESRVTFEGVDAEQLVGTLREPADRAAAPPTSPSPSPLVPSPSRAPGPRPLALLAHGYMSHRDAPVLVRLADALSRVGVASLRWDFAGNGDSAGRFRYGGYRREAREIGAAAALARGRGYRVAALAGHSKGATSSVVFAGGGGGEGGAVPPNLRVVNLAGRFGVSEGVERRLGAGALDALRRDGRVDGLPGRRASGEPFAWTLHARDLEDRLSTDVGAYCAAVAAAAAGGGWADAQAGAPRVLSIHCEGDEVVPAGEAARFHGALGGERGGHRLVVLPGGDHCFGEEAAAAAMVEEVVAWCCGG